MHWVHAVTQTIYNSKTTPVKAREHEASISQRAVDLHSSDRRVSEGPQMSSMTSIASQTHELTRPVTVYMY
jgi:hypothetical protein